MKNDLGNEVTATFHSVYVTYIWKSAEEICIVTAIWVQSLEGKTTFRIKCSLIISYSVFLLAQSKLFDNLIYYSSYIVQEHILGSSFGLIQYVFLHATTHGFLLSREGSRVVWCMYYMRWAIWKGTISSWRHEKNNNKQSIHCFHCLTFLND